MKVLNSLTVLSLVGLLLSACDKVKQPAIKKNEAVGSNFITNNNADVSGFKKILLEEYTGMKCIYCPDAATAVKGLSSQYTTSLITVAIHALDQANATAGVYMDQIFKTNEGDIWAGTSGFSIPSLPNGVINRKKYNNNSLTNNYTNWSAVVSQAIKDTFIVQLDVTTNYDTVVKALNTNIKATYQKAYAGKVNLTALLIEEGITGYQDVHGIVTPGYEFEHMMRGTLNSEWGQFLSENAKKKDTAIVNINNFDLKSLKYTAKNYSIKINDKNTYVVVYAYDVATRVVLQVEKVKLIK